ncbi:hypothetical protein [Paenibacillus hexagrammi]|uniref:Uncharacterized protein n=1 Tax=Paenibacillus hexagrammi TaxID=2908839 RepID=A0ABY3SP87_9BACL|nr:hypothetical protein [Paenibacillus sp. YPD9-1]UJF35509.1 hypothetical protein L0M14_10625 [Paenibacillus sp. YPD9-1]
MSKNKEGLASQAKNFINNPLGIIGLFLVLVDGIAGMVIILSKLNVILNLLLVLFIIGFPLVVLRVFFILVVKYHKNLYAPKDYNDEGNFVRTFDPNTNQVVQSEKETEQVESTSNRTEELLVIKETIKNIVSIQEAILHKVNRDENVIEIEKELQKNINMDMEKIINKRKQRFTIEISNLEGSQVLVDALDVLGYESEIYYSVLRENRRVNYFDSKEEHSAIWLGNNVPLKDAIEVIKASKLVFPHLRYIHLSNDTKGDPPNFIHKQIYIGGSTSTADNYGLTEMSDEDFLKLYECKRKTDFHSFIKSFY